MGQKPSGKGILSPGDRELIWIFENKKMLEKERERQKQKPRKTANDAKRIDEINKNLNKLSKGYSKFAAGLKEKFDALNEDLKIILQSEKLLSDLKLRESVSFIGVTVQIHDLSLPSYEEVEENSELIPNYSEWKIHVVEPGKVSKEGLFLKSLNKRYWLSTNEEKKSTVKDTSSPNFAISGKKGTWTIYVEKREHGKTVKVPTKIDVRKILYEALDLTERFPKTAKEFWILPSKEEDAITIREIRDRIEQFKQRLKKLEKSRVT